MITASSAEGKGNGTAESAKSKEAGLKNSSEKTQAALASTKTVTTQNLSNRYLVKQNLSKAVTNNEAPEIGDKTAKPPPRFTKSSISVVPTVAQKRSEGNSFFMVFYHLSLWTVLALLSGPFFAFFAFKDASERYPAYYGYRGFIGEKPKLNIVPDTATNNKTHYKTWFKIEPSKPSSYQGYVESMRKFASQYQNSPINGIDCMKDNFNYSNINDEDLFCIIDVYDDDEEIGLGPCALPKEADAVDSFQFGFDLPQPCFALKLNKLLDHVPDAPEATDLSTKTKKKINDICDGVEDCCHRNRLIITCETSEENVEFQIYPKAGISLCHWPYQGQPGYLAPFAMLQITSFPPPGIYFKMTCSAKTLLLEGRDIHDKPHILSFNIELLPKGST